MRHIQFIIFFSITSSFFLLSGCATQDKVAQLEYELMKVNQKFDEVQATSNVSQQRQADSSTKMSQLENEVMVLKSQLEETHHLNNTLKEQNKELDSQFKQYSEEEARKRQADIGRIRKEQLEKEIALKKEMNEKIRIQEVNLQAIQKSRIKEAERRAAVAKKAANEAKRKAENAAKAIKKSSGPIDIVADKKKRFVKSSNTKKSSVVIKKPVTQKSSQTVKKIVATKPAVKNATVSNADSLYKQKEFQKAFNAYQKQVTSDPKSEKGFTARFMMGECLFNLGKYDDAKIQYQKFISSSTPHPKKPAAFLKQGIAFEKTKESDISKLVYDKLIMDYPDSKEAKLAKERLDNI